MPNSLGIQNGEFLPSATLNHAGVRYFELLLYIKLLSATPLNSARVKKLSTLALLHIL